MIPFQLKGEAKYLGPIKKSNARINGSIVQVAGASKVLKAAGFDEDPESFFVLQANVLRLRRVQNELRKQLQQVESCIGYRSAPVTSKPKFDENLLKEIHAEAQHQAENSIYSAVKLRRLSCVVELLRPPHLLHLWRPPLHLRCACA